MNRDSRGSIDDAAAVFADAHSTAESSRDVSDPPAGARTLAPMVNARLRPLLFWVGKDDIGDAVIGKKQEAGGVRYALLIGSDPERTPRRINRWGYIAEEIRGDEATIVGVMTESDETSMKEAEANLQRQGAERTINVIRASVANGDARSVLTSVAAPADSTFRQVDAVLDLADHKGVEGTPRVIRLPAGTRPGFLSALADFMHRQSAQWRATHAVATGDPIGFAYHGKLYQLRATRSQPVVNFQAGGVSVNHAIASQFQIKNVATGDLTDFSVTFAVDGPLAEMPLFATYRPRWWTEIQLTLDDAAAGPVPTAPERD